jgi:hypothetical protein
MSSYRRNITIESLRSALRSARRSEQLAICFAYSEWLLLRSPPSPGGKWCRFENAT